MIMILTLIVLLFGVFDDVNFIVCLNDDSDFKVLSDSSSDVLVFLFIFVFIVKSVGV